MFSVKEKQMIAQKIEELLLSLDHPEMDKEKPKFMLKVWGAEAWSWADIKPNWTFEKEPPTVNLWNEVARDVMKSHPRGEGEK
jgi:hypothetical protein